MNGETASGADTFTTIVKSDYVAPAIIIFAHDSDETTNRNSHFVLQFLVVLLLDTVNNRWLLSWTSQVADSGRVNAVAGAFVGSVRSTS